MSKASIGQLRDYVELQRSEKTADGIGGFTDGPLTTYASGFARVSSKGSSEMFRAARKENFVPLAVVMRKGPALRVDDVVLFEGETLPVLCFDTLDLEHIEIVVGRGAPLGS